MKINLLVVPLALSLSACGYSPEELHSQAEVVKSRLPEGCEFVDAGKYNTYPVIAVVCDGRRTTTVSSEEARSNGKSTSYYPFATVVIEGKEYELKPKEGASE